MSAFHCGRRSSTVELESEVFDEDTDDDKDKEVFDPSGSATADAALLDDAVVAAVAVAVVMIASTLRVLAALLGCRARAGALAADNPDK